MRTKPSHRLLAFLAAMSVGPSMPLPLSRERFRAVDYVPVEKAGVDEGVNIEPAASYDNQRARGFSLEGLNPSEEIPPAAVYGRVTMASADGSAHGPHGMDIAANKADVVIKSFSSKASAVVNGPANEAVELVGSLQDTKVLQDHEAVADSTDEADLVLEGVDPEAALVGPAALEDFEAVAFAHDADFFRPEAAMTEPEDAAVEALPDPYAPQGPKAAANSSDEEKIEAEAAFVGPAAVEEFEASAFERDVGIFGIRPSFEFAAALEAIQSLNALQGPKAAADSFDEADIVLEGAEVDASSIGPEDLETAPVEHESGAFRFESIMFKPKEAAREATMSDVNEDFLAAKAAKRSSKSERHESEPSADKSEGAPGAEAITGNHPADLESEAIATSKVEVVMPAAASRIAALNDFEAVDEAIKKISQDKEIDEIGGTAKFDQAHESVTRVLVTANTGIENNGIINFATKNMDGINDNRDFIASSKLVKSSLHSQRKLDSICEDPDGFVDCVGGNVTDSLKTPCHVKCGGRCCKEIDSCTGFTGRVAKDNCSCGGTESCKDANVAFIKNGCKGERSCKNAGKNRGSIENITSSCNVIEACENAASNGNIVLILDSCNGERGCRGAARLGSIGRIISSCNSKLACVRAAQHEGSISIIKDSCNANSTCEDTAEGSGSIGNIISSCNHVRACENAARDAGEIGGLLHSCNKRRACQNAGSGDTNKIESGMSNCCSTSIEQCQNATLDTIQSEQCLTEVPSSQPSLQPSKLPSGFPSESPSLAPSESPSKAPSMLPSVFPSDSPSLSPSESPSMTPSTQPSIMPSQVPSTKPSLAPSESPSMTPSTQPSMMPSQVPSTKPSLAPSESPSKTPSAQPSKQPSRSPSESPSLAPSEPPSKAPSALPSQSPSESPSVSPSESPSKTPSAEPSKQPSTNPSESPSDVPSNVPSTQPSKQPSESPSDVPSKAPSAQPSTQPSETPTKEPSETPSSQPSSIPSGSPSSMPSSMPSGQPSSIPSGSPSSIPSVQPSSIPSGSPSSIPSSMPSGQPSSVPSESPSAQPSSIPSKSPSSIPSENPSSQPSSIPSESPSSMPSSMPSGQPSSVPSENPSENPSGQPSSIPSKSPSSVPSESPSSQPSSIPSESPSSMPSSMPSGQPSSIPSRSPSSMPSSSPSGQPSSMPSATPSLLPSTIPSTQPSEQPSVSSKPTVTSAPSFTTGYVISDGTFTVNAPLCDLTLDQTIAFVNSTCAAIEDAVCEDGDWSCKCRITGICGKEPKVTQASFEEIIQQQSTRRLQQTSEVGFQVITAVTCGNTACTTNQDIVNRKALSESITLRVNAAIQSRVVADSIATALSLDCLVAWGGITSPSSSSEFVLDVGTAIPTTGTFYPDWDSRSGTCINDNNTPPYMKLNPSQWIYDNLEACCDRYYSGYEKPMCMNGQGSGLWVVDWDAERCALDCAESTGGLCAGTVGGSIIKYSDPLTCCKTEVPWVSPAYCESDSLRTNENCYDGSKKYYSNYKTCVRDCKTGSPGCGGLVSEAHVQLYESLDTCCAAQFSWVTSGLCLSRSNPTTIDQYWADKTKSKCVKDSVTPAKDLTVVLYKTAKECCKESIPWKRSAACVAVSTGEAAQGSNEFYVDWKRMKCVQDCEGVAPCGGLAKNWNKMYPSGKECCDSLWDKPDECYIS